MVKIEVKDFSNEELEKRFIALVNKDNWEEECQWCMLPGMLHKHPCTRKEEANSSKYQRVHECWKMYRSRMKPILEVKQKEKEKEKEKEIMKMLLEKEKVEEKEEVDHSGIERFATVISESFTAAQKPLIDAILTRQNSTAKIMKPVRPPA